MSENGGGSADRIFGVATLNLLPGSSKQNIVIIKKKMKKVKQ